MNIFQTELIAAARNNIEKDPIYAQELLNEVLGVGDWKENQKNKRKETMTELKTKYGSDISGLKTAIKKVLGYAPSITTGPYGLRIKFKVPYKELPFDFMAMLKEVSPNKNNLGLMYRSISDYGKSLMLDYAELKPLIELVNKVKADA